MKYPNAHYARCPGCHRSVWRLSVGGVFLRHRRKAGDREAPWCNEEPLPPPPPDAMALRRELAAEGWYSHDRLTSLGWGKGQLGYSIWFERWDWHGRHVDSITFHAHTPDLSRVAEATAHAAALARKAWAEFDRDHCPRQSNDGRGVELDAFKTGLWAKFEAETTEEQFALYAARHRVHDEVEEQMAREKYAQLRARFERVEGPTP